MRNQVASAVFIAGLVLGSAAFTATRLLPAPTSVATATKSPAKRVACAQTWLAQKMHTGGHDAFMKTCIAKG